MYCREQSREGVGGEKQEMARLVVPWKELLLNSIDSNSSLRHSSYFQLATISTNGRPSNRTVVFRGFQEDSEKILINTDFRSRKVEEIRKCPLGEICWYFIDSWEQYRINGTIDILDASISEPILLQQRAKAWFASSLKSREQYLGPSPGLPCVSEESVEEYLLDPSSGPIDTFCLLVFNPEEVGYLNLKSNERLLFTFKRSGDGLHNWIEEKINP